MEWHCKVDSYSIGYFGDKRLKQTGSTFFERLVNHGSPIIKSMAKN